MAAPTSERRSRTEDEEPPPLLGAWWRLYAVVLAALALEIAMFWAFTQAFR